MSTPQREWYRFFLTVSMGEESAVRYLTSERLRELERGLMTVMLYRCARGASLALSILRSWRRQTGGKDRRPVEIRIPALSDRDREESELGEKATTEHVVTRQRRKKGLDVSLLCRMVMLHQDSSYERMTCLIPNNQYTTADADSDF